MKLTDVYNPKVMLVVYSNYTGKSHRSGSDNDVYIESAPIIKGKPAAMVPLSSRVAAELSLMLSSAASKSVGGFVPSNLIYTSFNGYTASLIWYTKPQKRKLLYDEHFKMGSVTITTPTLVWYYSNNELYLFAVKDDEPGQQTELYNAPFCNISTAGLVCLGSGTKVVKNRYNKFTELMESVEAAFWGTYFTSENHDRILEKGNLMSLHKELSKSKAPFPEEVLKPNSGKKFIKDLIDEKKNTAVNDEEDDDDED